MIDFVKILILDKTLIKTIWNNDFLTYYGDGNKLNKETAEIRSKEQRFYKNLIFTKTQDSLVITGSLHYYFNDGVHNANLFTVSDCINVINELHRLFNLDLELCQILNIEYGLNISLPFCIEQVITGLLYHERNKFESAKDLIYCLYSGTLNRFGRLNLYKVIKAYGKSLQFPEHCEQNTFRFEVKSCRTQFIHKLDIFTLKDLTNRAVYERISNELVKEWHKVLIIDLVNEFKAVKDQSKYSNTFFWYRLLQDKNRNKFTYHRNKYLDLLATNPNNVYDTITKLIETKISAILTPQPITKNDAILTNSIMQHCTNIKRYCILTQVDISMQRDDSILLSHTGLKYLYEQDKNEYNRIKNKYGSRRWINSDLETEIKELAHNIRNKKNNCNNRFDFDNTPTLF